MTIKTFTPLILCSLLLSCQKEQPVSTATTTTVVTDTQGDTAATVTAIANKSDKPFDRGWVIVVSPQFKQPEFFARIVLVNNTLTVRDAATRGFSPVPYTKTEMGFRAEEKSPTDGTRKWSIFSAGPLDTVTGSMEWIRNGKTTTYIFDGNPLEKGVFDGRWDLTLSRPGASTVAGYATFEYAALDLTIGDQRWGKLVFWVRPPTAGQPVDFMTSTPGGHDLVSWMGTLEENGQMVGWENVDAVKQPTLGGTISVRDKDGAVIEYRVHGVRQ